MLNLILATLKQLYLRQTIILRIQFGLTLLAVFQNLRAFYHTLQVRPDKILEASATEETELTPSRAWASSTLFFGLCLS